MAREKPPELSAKAKLKMVMYKEGVVPIVGFELTTLLTATVSHLLPFFLF
jgi:hypothetical protein